MYQENFISIFWYKRDGFYFLKDFHMNDLSINLLSQLLKCWYRDTTYLLDLIESNQIDLDLEEIKANFWSIDVNCLIYFCLQEVGEQFIEKNKNKIEAILWVSDLNEFRSYNDLYEIYTNYLDSHIWFKNEFINNLFENER